ncbi:MAG TPA: DUF421 domain-containing protein [Polyangiaceae bacterium]|nr:DUF421 domain-containing protein [Polyangiaceae bacterium]
MSFALTSPSSGAPPTSPFDLKRVFLGDEPPLFLAEIALRTAFIFAYTLLLLRLVGKRGVGQFSMFEVAIVIGLGSAVGDPMFYPDVPLSHAMVVITVVIAMYRALTSLMRRSERFELLVEGEPRCVVEDGRLRPELLAKKRITRDELFEILRQAGVGQLGQIKRAYLEQSGQLSTFAFPPSEVRPGLPIVPPWELEPPPRFEAGRGEAEAGAYAFRRLASIFSDNGTDANPASASTRASRADARRRPDEPRLDCLYFAAPREVTFCQRRPGRRTDEPLRCAP